MKPVVISECWKRAGAFKEMFTVTVFLLNTNITPLVLVERKLTRRGEKTPLRLSFKRQKTLRSYFLTLNIAQQQDQHGSVSLGAVGVVRPE